MTPNPLEKEIEKKIGAYAKSKGLDWIKFTSPQKRAVPDRMIMGDGGLVGFLEIKRKWQKPTPLQMRELQHIKSRGVSVGWVDNVDSGWRFIQLLIEHHESRTGPVLMGEGLV